MKSEYTLLFSLIFSTIFLIIFSTIFLIGKPPKNYRYTGLLFLSIFVAFFIIFSTSMYILPIFYRKFDIASKYDKDTIHILYNKYWTKN